MTSKAQTAHNVCVGPSMLIRLSVVLALLATVAACGLADQEATPSPSASGLGHSEPTATATPASAPSPHGSTTTPTRTPTPLSQDSTTALTPTITPASTIPDTTPTPTEAPVPPRRIGFVPLDNPVLVSAQDASYLEDDELVLGLESEGEARAYPLRMITFHHIINEAVQGKPLLVTF